MHTRASCPAPLTRFSGLGSGWGCLLTVDSRGMGRGWRRLAPKGAGGKQGVRSQGCVLKSPGGGPRELRDLQCLEVAGPRS